MYFPKSSGIYLHIMRYTLQQTDIDMKHVATSTTSIHIHSPLLLHINVNLLVGIKQYRDHNWQSFWGMYGYDNDSPTIMGMYWAFSMAIYIYIFAGKNWDSIWYSRNQTNHSLEGTWVWSGKGYHFEPTDLDIRRVSALVIKHGNGSSSIYRCFSY